MTTFRSTIAVGALALAALSAPARADVEHATVAMPAVAMIFATEYIAQDAGIYKAEGLDVKEQVIAGIGATNAVIAGSMDFGYASGVTLTRASAHNQPILGIARTYQHTGFWLVVSKKIAEAGHFDANAPLAERAKLLKGLRWAVGGSIQAIPHAYLNDIAAVGGLDPTKDYLVTAMMPTDQLASLEHGAVDGVSAGPPIVEQAVKDGIGVIITDGNKDPDWLKDVAANVVLTRPDTCEKRRTVCEKMGHATAKALLFMHQHQKEAMEILGKRVNVTDPAVLAEAFKHTLEATPETAQLDAQELATADRMNVEAGFMKREDMLSSYTKIFTNEFVK
ncbi:MAG TPA: ABC transporter substrate-binding protein [Stellaceae bacterium]|nr:ABC transporter substrate-binding protein [Stellaceae bacterium]